MWTPITIYTQTLAECIVRKFGEPFFRAVNYLYGILQCLIAIQKILIYGWKIFNVLKSKVLDFV